MIQDLARHNRPRYPAPEASTRQRLDPKSRDRQATPHRENSRGSSCGSEPIGARAAYRRKVRDFQK